MKRILKYAAVTTALFALAAPALAATLVLPSAPPSSAPAITGRNIVDIITTGVNYLLVVSVVLAVGAFVFGGVKYAMGDTKATEILKRAAWGLLAILGVGLVVNTIAGWLNRGLNLG